MIKLLTAARAMISKKYRTVILFTLVLAGLAVFLLTQKSPAPLPPEQWITVKPQRLENQLGLVGKIQPVQSEILTAPFEGVIRQVAVHEGQQVEKGQLLIVIDPGQIEIELRQAQADLLKSRKEVQQLLNWENSPEVSRARRNLQSIRTRLENTQANLRDTQTLFKRGIVARMEVDTLVQQLQSQQQELQAAEEELRLTNARGKGEDLDIAQMMLANARSRYQALALQVQQQNMRAPFAGFIVQPTATEREKQATLQAGKQVAQGTPLINVIGLEHIQIQTRVEETDVHQIKEGMPVTVTGDGFAGKILNGCVRSIAVQSDPAEMQGAYYNVIIAVETVPDLQQQTIRLGMSARLSIMTYQNNEGIAVPAQALHNEESTGETWVIYRRSSTAPVQKRVVTIGKTVAQGVEIHGVEAGEIRI